MFTGIIREIGIIKNFQNKQRGIITVGIGSKKIKPHIGDSIAVNGACLTVVKILHTGFQADIVHETLSRTNIGDMNIGDKVNLEQSIIAGERFDGHFVTGHVDAVSCVVEKKRGGSGHILKISTPKELRPFIVQKGSVCVNGVSLTIASATPEAFSIALIPFTDRNTNLGSLKAGDKVNIEIDIIARYLKSAI